MQLDWDIHPYVGVGQLKFGMTPDEVAAVLGPPDGSRFNASMREIRERRKESALQAVYSAENTGQLIELGFSPSIEGLQFAGVQLFTARSDDALQHVIQHDSEPLVSHGFIVFLGLGITMTGFDDDDAQKAVTVFEKGRWDAIRPEMQKFVFLGR